MFRASTWFERDRACVCLYRGDELVFELWDEAVYEAIEDGFLPSPRAPRPRDEDWLEPAISYARSQGLLS